MKRDVKALIAGLACWLLSSIAFPLAINHRRNLDLPPTSIDWIYHWLGISGLFLLLVGSFAVSGAAVSFSGRFDARNTVAAGLLFLAPVGLLTLISRDHQVHTFAWVFLIVPWFVLLVSGALLLVVGISRAVEAKLRS
jgi:hypothetical protein